MSAHTQKETVIKIIAATDGFLIVPRAFAQDHSISPGARSMLLDFVSRPQNWRISVPGTMKVQGLGRDKVRKHLNELQAAAYAFFDDGRGERGRFTQGTWYVSMDRAKILEIKEEKARTSPAPENQGAVNSPEPENPAPVIPAPENLQLQNKERTNQRSYIDAKAGNEGGLQGENGTDAFDRLCNIWPGPKMIKPARDIFAGLSVEDQAATLAAATSYAAETARKGTAPEYLKHLQNWLKLEPWVDVKAEAVQVAPVDVGVAVDEKGAIVTSEDRREQLARILKTAEARTAFAASMRQETPRLRNMPPRQIWEAMKELAREAHTETRANMRTMG